MMRGDVVTVAIQGDFGKPRPAVVIQSNFFDEHPSVTVLPITGTLHNAPLIRVTVTPDTQNGLQKTAQVMIDKAQTIMRDKIGSTIGTLDDRTMISINRYLAIFFGIA
jgi:mRNA interferase MazF